jgi:hypothetical protein
MKESAFWQQTKAGLDGPDVHLSRIENTAGTGISDVNMCCNGVEIFIELKMFHGTKLHFRMSQRSWIVRHLNCGGRVFVMARMGDVLYLYNAQVCMDAEHTPHADRKSFTVDIKALPPPLYVCKKPFKWREVREKLLGLS